MTRHTARRRLWIGLFAGLILAPWAIAQNGSQAYYDEVMDSQGRVRPWYKDVYRIYSGMSPAQVEQFFATSRADFTGDNDLLPLPRLMLASEVQTLKQGVEQRGNAIRAFLADHYSGKKTYANAGIFPPGVLERIIKRHGEEGYQGVLRPEAISFIYGPDSIRLADGSFAIIEDNPVFVGGFGDLPIARESLLRQIPEYQKAIQSTGDPTEFYRALVAQWRALANPRDGIMVVWTLSPEERADTEDVRINEILGKFGVHAVVHGDGQRLYADAQGNTFLESPLPNGTIHRQRVGFLFNHAEHKDFEPRWRFNREKVLMDKANWFKENYEVVYAQGELKPYDATMKQYMLQFSEVDRQREYKRLMEVLSPRADGTIDYDRLQQVLESNPQQRFRLDEFAAQRPIGIMEAMVSGKLPTANSPGLEFIGDKEFYVYVEKLIEFYLREKPVIKNLPTRPAAVYDASGRAQANPAVVADFRRNPENFVAKPVGGRGGDDMYIGPKLDAAGVEEAISRMQANPGNYIVQEFRHLSVLGNYIVDARMHSWVSSAGSVVSWVPWGRGLPIDGDGKVNLSAKGKEVTIIPVIDPQFGDCGKMDLRAF